MTPRDAVLAVLVVAIWGFNFPIAKVATAAIPPMFLVGIRFALIALVLVPFTRIPPQRVKAVAMLGFTFGVLHFVPMFAGIRLIDSSTAAISAQLQVPFATLLAVVILRERPGWRRWAGIGLAFLGMMVVAGEPRLQEGYYLGLGLVVLAAFTWACANLQMKGLHDLSPLALNGWMALFAGPLLLANSALFEERQIASFVESGWVGIGALVYMVGPVTLVGYGVWYRLVGRYPISSIIPFTLLTPVFGVLGGVVALGEPLTWPMAIGGIVTMSGVAVITLRGKAG